MQCMPGAWRSSCAIKSKPCHANSSVGSTLIISFSPNFHLNSTLMPWVAIRHGSKLGTGSGSGSGSGSGMNMFTKPDADLIHLDLPAILEAYLRFSYSIKGQWFYQLVNVLTVSTTPSCLFMAESIHSTMAPSTVSHSTSLSHSESTKESAPPPPSRPYSKHFHQRDPEATKARSIYLKSYLGGLFIIIITIFAVFPIYWGSLWKVPARPLTGWIVVRFCWFIFVTFFVGDWLEPTGFWWRRSGVICRSTANGNSQ